MVRLSLRRLPSTLLALLVSCRHLVVIVLFACVRYLVVLPFHAYLKRNSDIKLLLLSLSFLLLLLLLLLLFLLNNVHCIRSRITIIH